MEYIKKIDLLNKAVEVEYLGRPRLMVSVARIGEAPSIDIVRCKECKHNYNTAINHGKMHPRCDFTDRALTENDFCSRGEREGE